MGDKNCHDKYDHFKIVNEILILGGCIKFTSIKLMHICPALTEDIIQ